MWGRRPSFPLRRALLTLCSSGHLGTSSPSVADYIWDMTVCFSSLFLSPVDGKWQAWGVWGSCTTTCGGGTQRRDRMCYGPFFGGETCQGPKEEYKQCNDRKCPGMYPRPLTLSFAWGRKTVLCQRDECNKELWSSWTLPMTQAQDKPMAWFISFPNQCNHTNFSGCLVSPTRLTLMFLMFSLP